MKNNIPSHIKTKRVLIERANTVTIIAAGVAAFSLVFSAVSARAFFTQISYQQKVISAKSDTLKVLEDNLKARDSLVKSYEAFIRPTENIIGGSVVGEDGVEEDNAKIILDALPSKYDFPALTSSLEKLVVTQGLDIENITGTDDEVAQASTTSSAKPEPVALSFELKAKGPYLQQKSLLGLLERSIRPFKVNQQVIQATDEGLSQTITGETYYQPEKSLELKKEVLKP